MLSLALSGVACGAPTVDPADLGGPAPDSGRTSADSGPSATDAGPAAPDGGCLSDAECSDGLFCNGAERCTAGACVPAAQRECVGRTCLEAQARCGTQCVDADGDGACADLDCDDTSAIRYPGALERCDAIDNDCNPMTVGPDDDGDTFPSVQCCNPQPSGPALCGADCNDARATVNPSAVESCNFVDDDCDGMVDDGVTVALWPDADGDGYGDASATAMSMQSCRGTPGFVAMRGDCDDRAPGRNMGAVEVCNAIDDDCDGTADDIVDNMVFCVQGTTRPCTTMCGSVAGTERCGGDCRSWESCRATEVCNGCDDDLNGQIDNGFACPRGMATPCTTACGVPSTRNCTATCTFANACLAAEACNYCDDNGMNGFADEELLATMSDANRSLEGGRYAGVARQVDDGSINPQATSGSYDTVAQLLDGANQNQAGAYWIDLNRVQSWGPTTIYAELRVRTLGGAFPMGGWSVVVATGGTGDVGTPQERGVPLTRTGVRADWIWGNPDPSGVASSGSGGFDFLGYAKLPALWRGTTATNFGWFATGTPALGDTTPTAIITQRLTIVYQPPSAVVPVETVTITGGGTTRTFQPDSNPATVDPASDVPVGSRLSLGFTAGSWTYTRGAMQYGARVEASLYLTFHQQGSNSPPVVGGDFPMSRISRERVCPGNF